MDIPTGVEITVGYKDGTLRKYRRGDAVLVEDGMQFLGAQSVRYPADVAPVSSLSLPIIILYIGVTMLIYHYVGPVGLIIFGLGAIWASSIWKAAQKINADKKANNKQKPS